MLLVQIPIYDSNTNNIIYKIILNEVFLKFLHIMRSQLRFC